MRRPSFHQREGRKKILAMYHSGTPPDPIPKEKATKDLVVDDDVPSGNTEESHGNEAKARNSSGGGAGAKEGGRVDRR